MMTKLEATKAAKALKAKMKTKGWKIFVSKNIMWYYGIQNAKGMISIYPSFDSTYYCLLSDGQFSYCGSYFWKDHKRYADPNEAVDATIELAFDYAHKLMRHLNRVAFSLGTGRLICK